MRGLHNLVCFVASQRFHEMESCIESWCIDWQVDFWLKSLANSTSDSGFVSVRTLQLGTAFVCLVPGLSGPSTKNLFHAAMGCLLKAATVSSSTACTPANVELAVWLAVQLLIRRLPDIATV